MLKKVRLGDSLLSAKNAQRLSNEAYKQAMSRCIMLYPGAKDVKKTKVNRYQLTQKYSFKVEVPSFFTGKVLQFPYDKHKINLDIQLSPISLRKWVLPAETVNNPTNQELGVEISPEKLLLVPFYQFNMPLEFGKGFSKPHQINISREDVDEGLEVNNKVLAYYMVMVNPFPTGAHLQVRELINDFDIMPFSLQANSFQEISEKRKNGPSDWGKEDARHLRIEKHFQTSCVVTFELVRHIVAPVLSVLLPLWVIQLMLPFTWLMEVSPLNDAFAYLVGLLLTVTSHRGVMEEKMQFVQRITDPDIEFIKTITFLFLQMLLVSFFNGVAQDFYVATFADSHVGSYFMFKDGLNIGFLIFAVQLLYLTLRILRQLLRARHNSNLVSKYGDIALFDIRYDKQEPIISLQKYAECVLLKPSVQEMVRKELFNSIQHLHKDDDFKKSLQSIAKKVKVDRKTYFSYNVKTYSKQNLPSDLFRMQLKDTVLSEMDSKHAAQSVNEATEAPPQGRHEEIEWESILEEGSGKIGGVAYTKQLTDNGVAYGQKVVYDVLPGSGGSNPVQLEVQFIKAGVIQTRAKAHAMYKSNKLKDKASNCMPATSRLLLLLLKSIWFEVRHGLLSKGSCVKICDDIKLFFIAIQVNKALKKPRCTH